MRSLTFALAVVGVAGVCGFSFAAEKPKDSGAKACFERIKKLAGDWATVDEKTGNETILLKYRVIAGGSAVEESIMPGEPHEMVTVYHMDGPALMLTHYCAVGNQPRMKATAASTPAKIEFKCVGVSNVKSHNDMHMHHGLFTFQSDDSMVTEWTGVDKGKPGHAVKFSVKRKK